MNDAAPATRWSWLWDDPRRFDLVAAIATVGIAMLLIFGNRNQFDTGWPEVAAGVGAFVLVLFRRRQPLVLLTIAMIGTAVHVAIWERPTPMIFGALVLLATACVRLDRWVAIALGVVIAASLYVLGLVSNDTDEFGDSRAVIGIAWTAGAVGIADAVRSWRRYKVSAEAQLRSAVLATEARARQQVSDERLAIAGELHDLLAHNLSVMNVQTGAALHLLRSDPDEAEHALVAARDAGRSVLDELRELLSVLRHDGSGDVPTASLPTVEQVDALVETMRAAGLDVTWRRNGALRPLSPAVSLAAYRIVQESLTNAAKHGNGAAELSIEWDDAGVSIRVSNEVSAQPGVGGGHGLFGMRERATANGGRFRGERVGNRFEVEVWLPAIAAEETG